MSEVFDTTVRTRYDYPNGGFFEWDVCLTDEEIRALSKGLSPLTIRPDNIICGMPMWGEAKEVDDE